MKAEGAVDGIAGTQKISHRPHRQRQGTDYAEFDRIDKSSQPIVTTRKKDNKSAGDDEGDANISNQTTDTHAERATQQYPEPRTV